MPAASREAKHTWTGPRFNCEVPRESLSRYSWAGSLDGIVRFSGLGPELGRLIVGTISIRRLGTVFVALAVLVAGWLVISERVSAASATPVVYVATGENFPDALGAGPAAAMVKGPILLVSQNGIPGETAAELTRLSPDKIIIVGGTAVVSTTVETGLAAFAGTVERIAGTNRYDTAAKLSAATYPVSLDADTLDGKDSTAFLGKTEKAADADLLDGKNSADFVSGASWESRAWTFNNVLAGFERSVSIDCPGFKTPIAGGGLENGNRFVMTDSHPYFTSLLDRGWHMSWENESGVTQISSSGEIWVLCADADISIVPLSVTGSAIDPDTE